MSLRINQNVTSLSTYANLNRNSSRVDSSIKKLSSGLRINSAADDAAGLAISEKMRSQISGLNRAKLNAQDGMSMIQTAEGGLNETESIIQRMRELALQASNDTLTANDRLEIQKEVNQLRDAIDDISDSTEFNTKKLLDGSQAALVSASSTSVSGSANGAGVSGGDFNVSMTLVQAGISQMQTSQIFMNKNTGELANGSTKLEDVAQFYDTNGVFALSTPQTIMVSGNARTAEFTLDGKMTLNELAASLQNAIAGTNGLGLKNTQAVLVNTVQTQVSGMGGYLQITSGKVGDMGDFSIAGSQDVVDALGMTVSRASTNNLIQVAAKDGGGNTKKVTTSTDVANGLLDGIDMKFESTPAQIAGHGGIVDGLKFGSAQATVGFSFFVGTASININVNFDASGAYSMEGIASEINAAIAADATAKNSGIEATVVDGQIRLSYNPTDATSPTSIKISAGDDTLGLIAGTYSGFVDGDKELSAQVKGISVLASAATALTVDIVDGKGNTATINIGSGATTVTSGADLVISEKLMLSANETLANSSVNARLDIVNGSIAFTSTIIGQKNVNNGPAIQGTINITSSDVFLNKTLGYNDGTAKGKGDTNFRMHVVDNSPTFQIGANQGQSVNVNIGDMSASALGIDKLDMSTTEGSQRAIGKLDKALELVSAERSKLGAFANRMNYTISNLENAATNLTDAESRIRDLDMASEMTEFSSAQILQQAGTAMLAQANSSSQSVLQLLQ